MKLIDLVNRNLNPIPWSEGDNIPWNEPAFSQRMLKEHLSQEHDAASRRLDRIEQHVTWIHEQVLEGKPSMILDLGCGPGLYSHRLSQLGHHCHGIDFSPASIAYAKRVTHEEGLDCTFVESDLRQAEYGEGFDAVLQIYGEINVFKPTDARQILDKAFQALNPGGILVLEPHTFEAVEAWGRKPKSWYSASAGLNSTSPHIVLEEYFWDQPLQVTTNRYYVIDAASGNVLRYAQSIQAYTREEYASLLVNCGYTGIRFYPSLTGLPDPEQKQLFVISGFKPERP